MTDNDRLLFDGFCRAIILDWLRQSKYAGNKKIQDYILHEASYKKVALTAMYGNVIEEDASSDIKLSKAEEGFSDIFAYGAAMFAAPPLEKYVHALLRKGFKSYKQKEKVKKFWSGKPKINPKTGRQIKVTKQFAGMGGKPGTMLLRTFSASGSILTYMGVSLGLSLLTKVIFAVVRRIISKCRKTCNQRIAKNVIYRNLKVSICTSKCKIVDLKMHITKMRSEVKKCKSVSSNPEDCQQNIIKQISRMNKILDKEQKKLKGDMKELREKEQKRKQRRD